MRGACFLRSCFNERGRAARVPLFLQTRTVRVTPQHNKRDALLISIIDFTQKIATPAIRKCAEAVVDRKVQHATRHAGRGAHRNLERLHIRRDLP